MLLFCDLGLLYVTCSVFDIRSCRFTYRSLFALILSKCLLEKIVANLLQLIRRNYVEYVGMV